MVIELANTGYLKFYPFAASSKILRCCKLLQKCQVDKGEKMLIQPAFRSLKSHLTLARRVFANVTILDFQDPLWETQKW